MFVLVSCLVCFDFEVCGFRLVVLLVALVDWCCWLTFGSCEVLWFGCMSLFFYGFDVFVIVWMWV